MTCQTDFKGALTIHYLEKVSLTEEITRIYRAAFVLSTVSSLHDPSPLFEKFSDSSLNYFCISGKKSSELWRKHQLPSQPKGPCREIGPDPSSASGVSSRIGTESVRLVVAIGFEGKLRGEQILVGVWRKCVR